MRIWEYESLRNWEYESLSDGVGYLAGFKIFPDGIENVEDTASGQGLSGMRDIGRYYRNIAGLQVQGDAVEFPVKTPFQQIEYLLMYVGMNR